MNELIKVIVNEHQEQIVSGRELHEFLEIKDNYTDWMKRVIEYGFETNQDFIGFLRESNGGRPSFEHHIKLDMAKEICMITRNEKGKQARRYFIEIEKAWNNPEMVMARSLQYAQVKLLDYQKQLEIMQPKADFYDDVAGSKDAIEMSQVAKVLDMGIGRNKLFDFLRDNKIVMQDNQPYQQYIDRGYFRVVEQKYNKGDGSIGINIKTLVYQKGLDYIRKLLKEE